MSNNSLSASEKLALRRQALLVQCRMQRVMLAVEVRTLVAPIAPDGGWRQQLLPKLKVPLAIAGLLVTLIAAKPGRAVPILKIGATLWGIARTVLPMLRRDAAGRERADQDISG
jgi:hypothetical protein